MRRKLLLLLPVLAALMLCGCAYRGSNFRIETDEKPEGRYFDILIPIEESDEYYTEFNDHAPPLDTIPRASEIVTYNADGFRSMLMHMNGARINVKERSESGCITVSLPQNFHKKSGDPYGEQAFTNFCDKYIYCRIALFDEKGNVINVTDNIKLRGMFGCSYIDSDITYSYAKEKAKTGYIISVEIFVMLALLLGLSLVGGILNISLLLIYEHNHNCSGKGCMPYIVLSGIFTLPSVIYFALRILSFIAVNASVASAFRNMNIASALILLIIWLIMFIAEIKIFLYFISSHKKERENAENTKHVQVYNEETVS